MSRNPASSFVWTVAGRRATQSTKGRMTRGRGRSSSGGSWAPLFGGAVVVDIGASSGASAGGKSSPATHADARGGSLASADARIGRKGPRSFGQPPDGRRHMAYRDR